MSMDVNLLCLDFIMQIENGNKNACDTRKYKKNYMRY